MSVSVLILAWKIVLEMTYYVSGGTLNLIYSLLAPCIKMSVFISRLKRLIVSGGALNSTHLLTRLKQLWPVS